MCTMRKKLHNVYIEQVVSLDVQLYDICTCNAKVFDVWGKVDWTLILNLLMFYFLALFLLTPHTVSGGEGGLLSFFLFH